MTRFFFFSSIQVIPFPMSCDIRDECSCRDPDAIENREEEGEVPSLGWPAWGGTSVPRPRTLAPTQRSPSGRGRPLLHPPSGLVSCTCCLTGIPLRPYCNPDQLNNILLLLLHITERSRTEAGTHETPQKTSSLSLKESNPAISSRKKTYSKEKKKKSKLHETDFFFWERI